MSSTSIGNTRATTYRERLTTLYGEIRAWTSSLGLATEDRITELNEEDIGKYQAPGLTIKHSDRKLAELIPIGASIIGADGRVDISGPLDRETIIYLTGGGPHFSIMVREASGDPDMKDRPLFKGVEHDGWYWIEDPRFSKARILDRDLFINLLGVVSDYEP